MTLKITASLRVIYYLFLIRGESINVLPIHVMRRSCTFESHLLIMRPSSSTIAKSKGSCGSGGIEIVRFDCDSPQEPQGACDTGEFEVEIPEDIDKGK